MLTPRDPPPPPSLPENPPQRRIEPTTLHHAGQRAQHTTNWAIQAPNEDLKLASHVQKWLVQIRVTAVNRPHALLQGTVYLYIFIFLYVSAWGFEYLGIPSCLWMISCMYTLESSRSSINSALCVLMNYLRPYHPSQCITKVFLGLFFVLFVFWVFFLHMWVTCGSMY